MILCLSLLGCWGTPPPPPPPAVEVAPEPPPPKWPGEAEWRKQFTAIPPPDPPDPTRQALVDLGQLLYVEPRLSATRDLSCAACHSIPDWGTDGKPVAVGHGGKKSTRNTPSVFNASLQAVQFWDARGQDVEWIVPEHLRDPVGMGWRDDGSAVKAVRDLPELTDEFAAAFPGDPEQVSMSHIAKALAAYVRTLVTPGRFDAWVGGDDDALTDAEHAGLRVFVDTGCLSCHSGVAVGGGSWQKLGLIVPYETTDPGRQGVTGSEADFRQFKVPSLRNVARTGPYLHDGSIPTLDEAVRKMAKHELGRDLSDGDVDAILVFLGSLTADLRDTEPG